VTTPSAPAVSSSTAEVDPRGPRYKWIALSNTTLGILMATINGSIVLIALPDIFRGIHLDPLASGNTSYFLWILMGFMLVTAVLVVSFGRIGDIYGRVKMYNLGFAVFTIFSVLLAATPFQGSAGALWIVIMRVLQGVGGAFLFANANAIIADAFPSNERGLALGINGVAAVGGSFIGLLLGGLLGPVSWRLVFLVSVPFGLFGTVWAYLKLQDSGGRQHGKIDYYGNVTFAVGLVGVLSGIVYGLQPYGGHPMGWTNPMVLSFVFGGLALLIAFVFIELHVDDPMFDLSLFKNRAFSMGNVAGLLAATARGGLQFMLIIWLQGIWLPEHGYSFDRTPLWAGIFMIPLTVGFLISGPTSGILSDRFGARPFATGGMIGTAASFLLLELLPMNFSYPLFALLLLVMGLSMGLFSAPNSTGVMNSLPAEKRGVGAGMLNTFQNGASVLSIGVFFTIITLVLASRLPNTMYAGLTAHGVPTAKAHEIANLPPIGSLFSAFLGFNPVQQLLGSAQAAHVSAAQYSFLTGRSFFPTLIASPFGKGLHLAFDFAAACCFIAAVASWFRGGHKQHDPAATRAPGSDQPGHASTLDEAGIGMAGAADVAMEETGVGSSMEELEDARPQ
jgi:EmrB/QacA subfamily drug resistance transporter